MLVLEHHQREAVKFQDLWDAATLQGIINNIAWGVAINDPKYDLREWRYEMKMGRITKRAWRRLRGRVRAGKPIPVPPVLWIDFEAGPRVPMIDFAALYRKD
jgi:hypothetical protein